MKEKKRLLIVDDVADNIRILFNAFKDDCSILTATNGQDAIKLSLQDPQPDLILLDVMMPGMSGYEVCKILKDNDETKDIPVIFVTAVNEKEGELEGLSLGAVDYITKPINLDLVRVRVFNHLELKEYRDDLKELVHKRTQQLQLAKEATVEAMGIVAESRDSETGGHIQRTKNYMYILANKLSEHPKYKETLTKSMIDLLSNSAPLHDIGKIAIPDEILLKPGKLEEDEFEIMKEHAIIGETTIADVQKRLGESDFLNTAKEIAGSHHEKWDGSGYPRKLSGDDIPLSGRLMALADVYDALISKRSYKLPFTHEKVLEIITNDKAKHFDPDIVDVFLELHEEFLKISMEFST